MQSDNPIRQWPVKVVLMLIFVPAMVVLVRRPDGGMWDNLGHSGGWQFVVSAAVLVGYVGLLILLWRRRAILTVVFLGILLHTIQVFTQASNPPVFPEKSFDVSFRARRPVRVFCNGVDLGTTPLTLSDAELTERVPEWNVPPDQPHVSGVDEHDGQLSFFSAKWTWTPLDLVGQWKDSSRGWVMAGPEMMPKLKKQRFWWRFETDGLVSVRHLLPLTSGGSGSGNHMSYDADLSGIGALSDQKHIELIETALRDEDVVLSVPHLQYLADNETLFIERLQEDARRDPQAKRILNWLIDHRYALKGELTEERAASLLTSILTEIGDRASFSHPTIESALLLRISTEFPEAIASAFEQDVRTARFMGGRRSSAGNSMTWSGSSAWARQSALVLAIREVRPESSFKWLTFLLSRPGPGWRRDELLPIAANYRRPEAETYVQMALRSDSQYLLSQIDNPDADQAIESAFSLSPPKNLRSPHFGPAHDWIKLRLKTGDRAKGLASFVYHLSWLSAEDKARVLVCIPDESVAGYLLRLKEDLSARDRKNFFDFAIAQPQPQAGAFLVDLYQTLAREHPHRTYAATHVVLQVDSPETRKLLKDTLVNGSDQDWYWLAGVSKVQRVPHLEWLLPDLVVTSEDSRRVTAMKLVARIDTDAAWKQIEDWARNGSEAVQAAAAKQLAERETRRAIYQKKLDQFEALVAGRMSPDELLPPTQSFRWDGEQYVLVVPEAEDNATVGDATEMKSN